MVSLAAIVALGFLSGKINTLFSKAGNSLDAVSVSAPASSGGSSGGPPPPGSAPSGGSVSISNLGGGSIGGEYDDGDTIRATTLGWSNTPTSYTFTWQRSTFYNDPDGGGGFDGDETCDGTLSNYADVQGPTSQGGTTNDYPTPSQSSGDGDSIRVVVTAANGNGTSSSVSACVPVQN
jgi:hypothetical protein